jgi:hypothetical protein
VKKASCVFIFFLLVAFSLTNCKTSSNAKPAYTGQVGELIVVCPDNWWEGNFKDTILAVFQQLYPMLPQPEATFTISHFKPQDVSTLIERHRNVLWFGKDEKLISNVIESKISKDQLVVEIKARTKEEVKAEFLKQANTLFHVFSQKEIERIRGKLTAGAKSEGLIKKIKETIGVDIAIPTGFTEMALDSNFVWLQREKMRKLSGTSHFIQESFVIYSYPYSHDSTFTEKFQLYQRRQFLGSRIYGQTESEYMTVQNAVNPIFDTLNVAGRFTTSLRGLWRLNDAFLGGPFLSYTFLDKESKRVICVESFLMALKFDKRDYMRDLEAVLQTAK